MRVLCWQNPLLGGASCMHTLRIKTRQVFETCRVLFIFG
jgi:hypothetical protein